MNNSDELVYSARALYNLYTLKAELCVVTQVTIASVVKRTNNVTKR
jgi:hypothetical protein